MKPSPFLIRPCGAPSPRGKALQTTIYRFADGNRKKQKFPEDALQYKTGFIIIQIEIAFFILHHRSPFLTLIGYRSVTGFANVQIR